MIIIRFALKSFGLCVLALSLVACSQNREYSSIEPGSQSARMRSTLALPPDLVDTSADSLVTSQSEQPEETQTVLPEPASELDIKRNDEEGWIEVDASPDQVWNLLESYWGSLGVDLVVADRKTGTMVTDWVKPARADREKGFSKDNFMGKVLGNIVDAPSHLDKYTMQFERMENGRTRINVGHQGLRKIQTQRSGVATNANWEWVETEEDPNKIKRALSSIAYGLDSSGTS